MIQIHGINRYGRQHGDHNQDVLENQFKITRVSLKNNCITLNKKLVMRNIKKKIIRKLLKAVEEKLQQMLLHLKTI